MLNIQRQIILCGVHRVLKERQRGRIGFMQRCRLCLFCALSEPSSVVVTDLGGRESTGEETFSMMSSVVLGNVVLLVSN
jgi:hypothetical protein